MPNRPKRIIEIGTGIPIRLIVLARKKGHHTTIGVEKKYIDPNQVRQLLPNGRLPNFEFHPGTRASTFLRRQPPHSLDHAYSDFLLWNMGRIERINFLHQLFRVMKPGSRYCATEASYFRQELIDELIQAGFRVHVTFLPPERVKAIGSFYAQTNAKIAEDYYKSSKLLPPFAKVIWDMLRDNSADAISADNTIKSKKMALRMKEALMPPDFPSNFFIRIIAKKPIEKKIRH